VLNSHLYSPPSASYKNYLLLCPSLLLYIILPGFDPMPLISCPSIPLSKPSSLLPISLHFSFSLHLPSLSPLLPLSCASSVRYCREQKESQELERLLHCDGIWLHALRYQGKGWVFQVQHSKASSPNMSDCNLGTTNHLLSYSVLVAFPLSVLCVPSILSVCLSSGKNCSEL
jgi:hypothetical protein